MVAIRGIIPGAFFRSPQSGVRISSSNGNNVTTSENNNKPHGPVSIGKLVLISILSLFGINEVREFVADKDQEKAITLLANNASNMQAENTALQEQVSKLSADLNSKVTLDQIKEVVKKVTPSCVSINGGFGPYGESPVSGSGVIMITGDKRYILSAGHILEALDRPPVAMTPFGPMPVPADRNDNVPPAFHIRLYNNSNFDDAITFDATPVTLPNGNKAHSPHNEKDLVLLEIPDDVKLPEGAGVKLRDTTKDPVEPGEPLITVGNPFGLNDSVGFGIASHTNRKHPLLIIPNSPAPDEGSKAAHIETDATAGPGNSGGGVFDIKGRLTGIISWGDPAANFGGAVRSDEVQKVLEDWGIKVE